MRVEAFSRGKIHARPQDNEDAVLALPGLGYAVIDGVSDRSGRTFDGVKGGLFAARVVRRAAARFLAEEDLCAEEPERARALVAALNAALREGYARLGLENDLARAPALRAGCAIMVALHEGDALTLIGVGDCGARLEGEEGRVLIADAKPLDRISTLLRREAWRALEARGAPREVCAAAGAQAAGQGVSAPLPGLSANEAADLAGRVRAVMAHEHPDLPPDEVTAMIGKGISGQRAFANRADLGLGYGVIDGFGTPDAFIITRRFPLAGLRGLELFSDGYFDIPEASGLDAFEAAHAQVERTDFDKLDRFASMKGSSCAQATDDRTYLRAIF